MSDTPEKPGSETTETTSPRSATTTPRPAARRATTVPKTAAGELDTSVLTQMVEDAPINIMFADTDGIIRYINRKSMQTLRRIEQQMPCRVEELVGQSYDIFHKNPQRVRNILADPRNLPHKAIITYAGEKLSLHATAVYDLDGNFTGVMQTWDIVTEKLALEAQNADYTAQIQSIDRSQAVLELTAEGEILSANRNFLELFGYTAAEVKGQHHRLFVDAQERDTAGYRDLWQRIGRGEFVAGEFKRQTRSGKELWLSATFSPLTDSNGRVYKVVEIARDVTAAVQLRHRVEGILKAVAESARDLNGASEELSAVAQQMTAAAEETSAQATSVSSASEEVSRNVQSVAAGSEEMSASIREIAKNAADAARVASQAVNVASSTNTMMMKLGDSSADIGKVVRVITSIAQQTKLLALNATIEAARAGEAGKGFAVVANEVKELAKETAKATEEISGKIETIQVDTRAAVAAIAQISSIIHQINDIQNSIASAVEEQTATTNEMSRSVAEGARGSNDIAANITHVAQAARETSSGAAKSLKAATALAQMASALENIVKQGM
jgi:methyl-accepting chemotaxis protein